MNTTATWYRRGAQVQSGSSYIGCVGYDGGPVVGRFAFTAPDHGAAALLFQTAGLTVAGATTVETGDPGKYRFDLTTDPDAHIRAVGTEGYPIDVSWSGSGGSINNSEGQQSFRLMPGRTYYLWIFPSQSSYNLWRITGVSVTLSGSYGNPARPSLSDGYFGESIGITLSGGSAGARYTVTASCAGRTETLQTKGSAAVLSWTPALADYGPRVSAGSATATVTVETWYGSTLAGTRSAAATLRFRASDVQPELSAGWYSHAPYNAGRGAGMPLYLQGISRAEISFDATKITPKYGAAIAGYTVSCAGEHAAASPYRTGILTGESTVTVTVTDTRGFSASESFSITPLAYQTPALSGVSVFRCDDEGTAAEAGRYLSVTAAAVYSSLGGANGITIRRSLRQASGSFGAGTVQADGATVIVPGLDPDLNYELKLEISDTVGGSSVVLRQIPGQQWAIKLRPGGRGIAFGMAPQADRQLEIPADWEIRRGTERYVPLTESGSSGIWRWEKWADGRFTLLGSSSAAVNVTSAWGALYYGTVLSDTAFPFAVSAIDYAGAFLADAYCFVLGELGASLSGTGRLYAVSPVERANTTIPLRLLIQGRWQ